MHVEVAVGKIRRQDVQPVVAAGDDEFVEFAFTGDQFLGRRVFLRLTAQDVGGGALRVQIPQQAPLPARRAQESQVHGSRGLADSALDVRDRDDLHPSPLRSDTVRLRLLQEPIGSA